jgi:hypothetical protein
MTSQACPRSGQNKLACSCPKTTCENHGKCCLCIAAHRGYGTPVNCMAALVAKK